jgi:uncharacterized protein (TIGR02145 family)
MNILYHKCLAIPITPVKNGLLYNYYSIIDVKFCPSGWHILSWNENTSWVTYMGGESVAGGKLKETGLTYWNSPNTGATNEYGWNGRGGGFRAAFDGTFSNLKILHQIWLIYTASPPVSVSAVCGNSGSTNVTCGSTQNAYGLSVRFVKNDSTNTGTMQDNDGNTYLTVKINNLVFTASNILQTKLNDNSLIPEITDNTLWKNSTTPALCAYNNDWSNV